MLGQPYGEAGLIQTYAQIFDLFAGHSPRLVTAPSFTQETGKAYGPVFLDTWGPPAYAEDITLITESSKNCRHGSSYTALAYLGLLRARS